MKHQATAYLHDNNLHLEGTNVKEPFDLISDFLLLVPYLYKGMFISLGVYLQAKVIFDRYEKDLMSKKKVNIYGHSLGAGIGCVIAIMMLKNGYEGNFFIEGKGGVKCLGTKARDYLYRITVSILWQIRHRDPVPHFGWWYAPFHYTPMTGNIKAHPLDYDIAEHTKYSV